MFDNLLTSMQKDFTQKLMRWNRLENNRSMPWKGEADPYKIWVSEIILQQTRVEQGWNYYERFITAFPTIDDLAAAPKEKVFKLWEGLGYYSRCANLIETAKKIVKEYNGKFPDTYKEILCLKGVGPYTAAAISSFAFQLPYAVVDGNVERVLSRYFGINTPVNSGAGKKLYAELAQTLMDIKQPGLYNQAIMDFGAVVCKPKNPLCQQCVQQRDCQAFQHGWVSLLPVKEKKIAKKERWFLYFIIRYKGKVYIRQRIQKDIWKNLFEFPLYEVNGQVDLHDRVLPALLEKVSGSANSKIVSCSKTFTQQLTHQKIYGKFVVVDALKPLKSSEEFIMVKAKDMHLYPFPKVITQYLKAEMV